MCFRMICFTPKIGGRREEKSSPRSSSKNHSFFSRLLRISLMNIFPSDCEWRFRKEERTDLREMAALPSKKRLCTHWCQDMDTKHVHTSWRPTLRKSLFFSVQWWDEWFNKKLLRSKVFEMRLYTKNHSLCPEDEIGNLHFKIHPIKFSKTLQRGFETCLLWLEFRMRVSASAKVVLARNAEVQHYLLLISHSLHCLNFGVSCSSAFGSKARSLRAILVKESSQRNKHIAATLKTILFSFLLLILAFYDDSTI